MNNLLSQKWCLCLNIQNHIKLCRAKNQKFGDDTTVRPTVFTIHYTLYSRVYQNLAISSENYRTFPKVGPHYKEKACKFLARSDYSLRPNSCVLLEILVVRRKKGPRSNMDT